MNRLRPHSSRRRSGFTLMEIMTVLVLLGVMAVASLNNSNMELDSETERLKSHLRYAQIRAQGDTYQWHLVFTDSRTYQIGPVVVTGAGFTPGIVPGTGTTQGTLDDGVITTNGTVIRFDSLGRPVSDNGSLLTSNQTITLVDGEETRDITIQAQTGLIP